MRLSENLERNVLAGWGDWVDTVAGVASEYFGGSGDTGGGGGSTSNSYVTVQQRPTFDGTIESAEAIVRYDNPGWGNAQIEAEAYARLPTLRAGMGFAGSGPVIATDPRDALRLASLNTGTMTDIGMPGIGMIGQGGAQVAGFPALGGMAAGAAALGATAVRYGAGLVRSAAGLIRGVMVGGRFISRKRAVFLAKRVGLDAAAAALGVGAIELAQMVLQEEGGAGRRRGRGVTAAQMRTTRRTMNVIERMHKQIHRFAVRATHKR